MVKTILHESLHSFISGQGIKEGDDHNTFNKYHSKMVEGLKEYNSENNLGLTDVQITELAFTGTQASKQFKGYIQGIADQNGTTYDDEYKAYQLRIGQLEFRLVKTEDKKNDTTDSTKSQ